MSRNGQHRDEFQWPWENNDAMAFFLQDPFGAGAGADTSNARRGPPRPRSPPHGFPFGGGEEGVTLADLFTGGAHRDGGGRGFGPWGRGGCRGRGRAHRGGPWGGPGAHPHHHPHHHPAPGDDGVPPPEPGHHHHPPPHPPHHPFGPGPRGRGRGGRGRGAHPGGPAAARSNPAAEPASPPSPPPYDEAGVDPLQQLFSAFAESFFPGANPPTNSNNNNNTNNTAEPEGTKVGESRSAEAAAAEASSPSSDIRPFSPPLDLFATPSSYVLHLALPGAKKEDVGIDWDADRSVLRVAGVVHRPGDEALLASLLPTVAERRVGFFERVVSLPPAGAAEAVAAARLHQQRQAAEQARLRVEAAAAAAATAAAKEEDKKEKQASSPKRRHQARVDDDDDQLEDAVLDFDDDSDDPGVVTPTTTTAAATEDDVRSLADATDRHSDGQSTTVGVGAGSSGDFYKEEIDGDGITAKMEDGVLIVTVPKVERGWTDIRKVDID